MSDDKPRTHKWVRREGGPAPVRKVRRLEARIPDGDAPDPQQLAESIRAALAGWPICVLRVSGKIRGRAKLGRHPGRWLRNELGYVVDEALWSSPGPRANRDDCHAFRLLGRHGKGFLPDGEAWSPLALRPHGMPTGSVENADFTAELAFAGLAALRSLPRLVDVLRNDPPSPPAGADVAWTSIQGLHCDEDGDLRWRKFADEAPYLPLDKLAEPRVRRTRLVMAFHTSTPVTLRGEGGEPSVELPFVLDRMTRSFGAWMGRTGHKGPRLPVDDILRAAAVTEVAQNNTHIVEIPQVLLTAEGSRAVAGDDASRALAGEITWRGDFVGLAPLLRAAAWIGMGPGRQHGLGQIGIG